MSDGEDDRLELALQASREGIWDWNVADGSIYYSPRVIRFMGYRKGDMPHLIDDRKALMDEGSVESVDRALRRVCQEGEELFAVEPRLKTKEGRWKWFRVRGTPVRDGLGTVVRIAGSMIDITKRKEAEHELTEERALIQTLMDNIPMNVYFKDRESRFTMANLPTAKKLGRDSPEELVGKTDADFFSDFHASHTLRVEREIMETGRGIYDVTEHEKWQGKEDTWVKSTKHPWMDSNGEVQGIFGVTSDVSELMRARDAQQKIAHELQEKNAMVEEERQRLRLVIDSVPMNIYFKNRDHQFVLVNRSLADWMGFEKPEELYDLSDRDIFSQEHWERTEKDERELMETGVPLVDQIERETWRGRNDTYVMTSKYPWRDSEGEIVGTFGVSSDVSDLVSTQRKLAGLAEAYQKKNEEMAGELDLAREVQAALLPEDIPPIEYEGREIVFAQLYQPAKELTGDFYEVIQLGEGKVGFLICDVFGQGVRSALIVSMLRGLIEKQAQGANDAGEFLTELNIGLTHLLEESDLEIRATAVYGIVNLGDDTIQISVAGHFNPIAVFEDGVRQVVPTPIASGPALGLDEMTVYGSVSAPLRGLKRMICYNGGVRDAHNEKDEEFGLSRMLEVIERGGEVCNILERLSGSVRDFSGKHSDENAVCLLGWEVKR